MSVVVISVTNNTIRVIRSWKKRHTDNSDKYHIQNAVSLLGQRSHFLRILRWRSRRCSRRCMISKSNGQTQRRPRQHPSGSSLNSHDPLNFTYPFFSIPTSRSDFQTCGNRTIDLQHWLSNLRRLGFRNESAACNDTSSWDTTIFLRFVTGLAKQVEVRGLDSQVQVSLDQKRLVLLVAHLRGRMRHDFFSFFLILNH